MPADDEVKLTVQDAVPVVALDTRLHGEPEKLSAIPVSVKVTVPAGLIAGPGFDGLSITVAVQFDGCPTSTGLVQDTVVSVDRNPTVMALPVAVWLATCAVSRDDGVKLALMLATPGVVGEVKLAEHVEFPTVDVGMTVHGEPVTVPMTPASVNVTVPAKATGLPDVVVSVTTAMQMSPWLTTTWPVHETVVDVDRGPTLIAVDELWLLLWMLSLGAYPAVTLADPDAVGAMKVELQEEVPVDVWTSAHGEPENVPETPVSENKTLPVGVRGDPFVELSATVAVHMEP